MPVAPLSWIEPLVGAERVVQVQSVLRAASDRLDGRTVWHVSDNPVRGGVAELLRSNLPYLAGGGILTRWTTLDAPPEFRQFTKALYYQLCGVTSPAPGTGPDADPERGRRLYERVCKEYAARLAASVGRHSVVVLHDHQTAGLVPHLREAGCTVVWRAHIGAALRPELAAPAWDFLTRYLTSAHRHIASYPGVLPAGLAGAGSHIVPPSIDPLSPKNLSLQPGIDPSRLLAAAGLIQDSTASVPGSHAFNGLLLRHPVLIVRDGGPVPARAPLVTQVSRWDRVKDIPGVIRGFAEHVDAAFGAHLLLVGPNTTGDRQAQQVFEECRAARSALGSRRERVHLVQVPTDNPAEHALTINAIQRRSTVLVQKSLAEGFGLTVSEAAWKGRPVVAAPVGGIRQQIEHGTTGLLLSGPRDLPGFGAAVNRLLASPRYADELGRGGRERVLRHFLTDSNVLGIANVLSDAAQIR
ncbi:glycosyltransferase [Streptomyces pinistramenti]|uniref:glycosyltransferase n=1 Tax=Streptomyces pinistramenti TaxID=2884812 RepID=UPI001D07D4E8|nr:glycosyltransferase [Streptomyces pinistramenti]MCB5906935.1 glycosyltransferase [Streptomyces pinistramenti]